MKKTTTKATQAFAGARDKRLIIPVSLSQAKRLKVQGLEETRTSEGETAFRRKK